MNWWDKLKRSLWKRLNEWLDFDTDSEPQPDQAGNTRPEKRTVPPRSSGKVEIETRGISHPRGRNDDGGNEYIFFSMFGSGFVRVLLYHCAGSGRSVRCFVDYEGDTPSVTMFNIADDTKLGGWHKWGIQWGGGELRVFLDDVQVGRTAAFNGLPETLYAGGYPAHGRNFKGEWRGLVVT